ncbi:MAG: transglutaminase-like domain-containing protein [Defluviitaleaceae bacterium]|nr:transglutaminase-like domain-containing protein [Defluviitaleaceae bacterium]
MEKVELKKRVAQLSEFPDFADDGIKFDFTFDLNRRDLYGSLIEEFKLDEVTAGYEDVDLMLVLLTWLNNNFKHNGASDMPEKRDAVSIVGYIRENPEGINCRGLSILYAELLRLYGIEAKHITCMPLEDDYYVHVVTHAFSRKLQQWIMIDPSFGLYFKDADGNYMDLHALRCVFAEGTHEKLIAPKNHPWFEMGEWASFMSDYLFRFSTATNFTFGSDFSPNIELRENSIMLIPVGFSGNRPAPKPHSAIFSVFLPKCYSVRTPTYLRVCGEPAALHFNKNPQKSDESRFQNRSNDSDLVTTSAENFFAPPK